MYQRLRITATHLCRIFLAPYLNFNIIFQYFLVYTSTKKAKAGISWRIRKVAPHIPHVLYALIYEIVKVQLQASARIQDKIKAEIISLKST